MKTKRWTAWAAAAVVFCCAAGSLSAKGPIVFGVRAGLQTQGLNPSTGADLGIANADKDFGYQLGFLARTSRGRCATELAYRHLGRTRDGQQLL